MRFYHWDSAKLTTFEESSMLKATDKIDLVTQEKDGGVFKLYLVIEAEEDYSVREFEKLLRDKTDNYATYFLDGQMHKQYPEMNQREITIYVQSVNTLSLSYLMLVNKLATKLGEFGIHVTYERL